MPYKFLNFEKYPKFSIEEGNTGSAFISELIERVVEASDANPLYRAYLEAVEHSLDRLTISIYEYVIELLSSFFLQGLDLINSSPREHC